MFCSHRIPEPNVFKFNCALKCLRYFNRFFRNINCIDLCGCINYFKYFSCSSHSFRNIRSISSCLPCPECCKYHYKHGYKYIFTFYRCVFHHKHRSKIIKYYKNHVFNKFRVPVNYTLNMISSNFRWKSNTLNSWIIIWNHFLKTKSCNCSIVQDSIIC